jgi:hypothetical protein
MVRKERIKPFFLMNGRPAVEATEVRARRAPICLALICTMR